MLRPDGSRQLLSRVLNKLRTTGFVDLTPLPDWHRSRTHAWYLTPEGARLTRDLPVLRGRPPYPITSSDRSVAEDTTHAHRRTRPPALRGRRPPARARARPVGLDPEVSHPIGEGERLVADAVMHYTVVDGEHRRKLRAFVEVDRTTMSSERLAVKLIEYARLHEYEAQPVGRRRPASTGPAWLQVVSGLPPPTVRAHRRLPGQTGRQDR